jgi:hypothetical protein
MRGDADEKSYFMDTAVQAEHVQEVAWLFFYFMRRVDDGHR